MTDKETAVTFFKAALCSGNTHLDLRPLLFRMQIYAYSMQILWSLDALTISVVLLRNDHC